MSSYDFISNEAQLVFIHWVGVSLSFLKQHRGENKEEKIMTELWFCVDLVCISQMYIDHQWSVMYQGNAGDIWALFCLRLKLDFEFCSTFHSYLVCLDKNGWPALQMDGVSLSAGMKCSVLLPPPPKKGCVLWIRENLLDSESIGCLYLSELGIWIRVNLLLKSEWFSCFIQSKSVVFIWINWVFEIESVVFICESLFKSDSQMCVLSCFERNHVLSLWGGRHVEKVWCEPYCCAVCIS